MIFEYWVASDQKDSIVSNLSESEQKLKAFWNVLMHMQDFFLRIPYSSSFFLKEQKKDFSKHIACIIRESPEW